MITQFNKHNSINEKNIYGRHGSIIMIITNSDEYEEFKTTINKQLIDVTKNNINPNFNEILLHLNNGLTPYIRYMKNSKRFSYGTIEYLEENDYGINFDAKFYMVDLTKFVNLIKNDGEIQVIPKYMLSKEERGRRFIREELSEEYSDDYKYLAIEINNLEELNKVYNYIIKNINPLLNTNVISQHYNGLKSYIDREVVGILIYYFDNNCFRYGNKKYTIDHPNDFPIEKFYNSNELDQVKYIIEYDKYTTITPNYMLSKEDRAKRFIREGQSNKYSDDYDHVALKITNVDELNEAYEYIKKEINPLLAGGVNDDFIIGIKSYIDNGEDGSFMYYFEDNHLRYSSKRFFDENSLEYKLEKYYDINEISQFKYIIENDAYPNLKPRYMLSKEDRAKRFIREGKDDDYFSIYDYIVIKIENLIDLDILFNQIENEIQPFIGKSVNDNHYSGMIKIIEDDNGEIPNLVYNLHEGFLWGRLEFTLESDRFQNIEKIFTINDLNDFTYIIKNNKFPKIKPNYMLSKEDRSKRFIYENFNEFLLERSSLTKLGIPREVMQPIQKDLALSPDAGWDKMKHKKDIISDLKSGEPCLFVQVALDNIKIFVSYPSPKGALYFVDNYIYRDTDWSGEFEKLKREYKTLTQLSIDIEPKSNIYKLDGDFSINKQGRRKFIKKEKSFMEFSDKFKTDFLQKFDKILKRISGTNFKKAKDKVTDKAKKIALENSLLIKGLDNPLNGPNGLSILDEFLYQFEEEYSKYFEERIDIQELSEYFTKDKLMTMFMYYIYTGKILTN